MPATAPWPAGRQRALTNPTWRSWPFPASLGKGSAVFSSLCASFFFAFSTILSWNFFGKLNVAYLFGKRATAAYSVLGVVFIFLGSCLSNDLVWSLSDLFNQLMVLPNALALLALSSLVVKAARRRTTKTPASHH